MSRATPGPAEEDLLVRDFLLFERRRPFDSDERVIAAWRTERFTDHATMPRHARIASPIAPRTAPTAMNRVPSGMLDFCIYGASAVGGTVTTG